MAKKRSIKVYGQSGYKYKETPMIMLKGMWLKDRNLCLVYHKHHINHPYHSHSRCGTLRKAIRDIKSHDEFQLNGRKPVYKH